MEEEQISIHAEEEADCESVRISRKRVHELSSSDSSSSSSSSSSSLDGQEKRKRLTKKKKKAKKNAYNNILKQNQALMTRLLGECVPRPHKNRPNEGSDRPSTSRNRLDEDNRDDLSVDYNYVSDSEAVLAAC